MTKVRCCAERSDAAIYNIDRAGLLAAHGGVSGGQVPRSACARNEVDGYQESGENKGCFLAFMGVFTLFTQFSLFFDSAEWLFACKNLSF